MILGWTKQKDAARKLVVGLGNPGRKYAGTRHNVGFEVVSDVGGRFSDQIARNKFQGEVFDADIHGVRVTLLRPHTFMNLSGTSVQAAMSFYKLPLSELLVVCDDFALPLAKLRFRAKGSAGGQKGLADVIRKLGSDQFARLRIGIGTPPENWDVSDFVLSRFDPGEATEMEETIRRAARGVADWVVHGTAHCMNEYNGK